eukprot:TRINITY_DN5379_c0_g1_i5.p1 TRINITY_DN5379_c0_g1~~TRINITY_DN5379_c0_g1_i5.p1  ORF type:complete len:289 (+),score=10.79 TRINITY_DN5379_c0_g1_i5:92-958(+)
MVRLIKYQPLTRKHLLLRKNNVGSFKEETPEKVVRTQTKNNVQTRMQKDQQVGKQEFREGSPSGLNPGRVIIHLDIDAFYAQVEEVRQPSLRNVPLGVTQKHIIVTCNYQARSKGVRKLQTITSALKDCPDLVLVSGEDLTPYRTASCNVQEILERNDVGVVERIGMEEFFIDLTDHVNSVVQNNKISVDGNMDNFPGNKIVGYVVNDLVLDEKALSIGTLRLIIGSQIAEQLRCAVFKNSGLKSSAGIGCNKLMAKLVSGKNKPNNQTTIFPWYPLIHFLYYLQQIS